MAPIPAIYKAPPAIPQKPSKANNLAVTPAYLANRTARAVALGYGKPRWIEFCEVALRRGLTVNLYEARRTVSKYVTLRHGGKSFKVRFSDHKPIPRREAQNDCDFFVGVTNQTVTTTGDAVRAALAHFGV
ncbi:hypothetical protein [Rhizobium sp. 768_B6_N1_8]|uniref:hypothetical protein n=1 Tax=unclassified Rhizobium TaxID=2613769 RepID=UPI003F2297C4